MSENTMFFCLGGTGTQIGTAIGHLYPLLKEARIADNGSVYKMFIMDKDTRGKNYEYCVNTAKNYGLFYESLPFDSEPLPPYNLEKGVYQELQHNAGILNSNYTVMNLIGEDDLMQKLANMCWKEEKQNELLRDGNNRDPSRGSLDANVCLEHFEQSSLFKELEETAKNKAIENLRLVLLGGITGGMGSSLIVPLVKKIKNYYNKDDPDKIKIFEKLRIDLVLLGTYFLIPVNPDKKRKVDDIGETIDSYYRVCDQLRELEEDLIKEFPNDPWYVYYAAIPLFDDICGEFQKNGASKRFSHLLELTAALSSFALKSVAEPGLYQTVLPADEKTGNLNIGWGELPLGNDIKISAKNLMRLISIIVCQLYPRFSQEAKDLKKDVYVKKYIKNPQNDMQKIEAIRTMLKEWLTYLVPYFEFWNEIQNYSKFGGTKNIVLDFFTAEDMKDLSNYFSEIFTNPFAAWENKPINKMPLLKDSWMNYLFDFKQDKTKLKKLLEIEDNTKEIFFLMIKDIYKTLEARKEE